MNRLTLAGLTAALLLCGIHPARAQVPGQQVFQYNAYKNITTATTTVVKGTNGLLHSITVNTEVASATITVYDNTAASGTKIATITLPSTITGINPFTLVLDVGFTTGLTVVTSGATDLTVAYK